MRSEPTGHSVDVLSSHVTSCYNNNNILSDHSVQPIPPSDPPVDEQRIARWLESDFSKIMQFKKKCCLGSSGNLVEETRRGRHPIIPRIWGIASSYNQTGLAKLISSISFNLNANQILLKYVILSCITTEKNLPNVQMTSSPRRCVANWDLLSSLISNTLIHLWERRNIRRAVFFFFLFFSFEIVIILKTTGGAR